MPMIFPLDTKAKIAAVALITTPLVAEGGAFVTWQGYSDDGRNSLFAFAGDRLWEHDGSVLHRLVISVNGKYDTLNRCFVFLGAGISVIYCEERQGASLSGAVWVEGKKPATMECASACTSTAPRTLAMVVENEEGDSGE